MAGSSVVAQALTSSPEATQSQVFLTYLTSLNLSYLQKYTGSLQGLNEVILIKHSVQSAMEFSSK